MTNPDFAVYSGRSLRLQRGAWAAVSIAAAIACADAGARRSAMTTIDSTGDTIVALTTAGPDQPVTLTPELAIGNPDGPPEYEFSAIGDLAVGRAGEIFVYDRTAHSLRLYDAQGKFIRQIGRKGSGPGEFDRVNGIVVRADGKLALWDAGNGRINLYAPDGDHETTWSVGSGYFTSRALLADSANNIYTRATVRRDSTQPFGIAGLIRRGPDGTVIDSLVPPLFGDPRPATITISKDGSSASYGVPFHPANLWAFSPHGYFVAGHSARYAVYLVRDGTKPIRIERTMQPVPIDPGERAEAREQTLFGLRQSIEGATDARWNGPEIPEHKAFYRSLSVDGDGRIWVSVSLPSEKIPDAELQAQRRDRESGDGANLPPITTWRESTAYDVFAPTGHYLGRVVPPPWTTFHRMRGDEIWGVTLDSLDVPQVVRYRVRGWRQVRIRP